MTPSSRLLLVLPLLTLTTGCEVLADYLPTVSFDRLDVSAVDWNGVSANFVFKIDNPNPIQIKLARFDYALAFSDVEWLQGDDPDGLELAASGASELALPVSIEFQSLYDVVQATRGVDTIPFALSGSFGFDTPAGIVDLPYDADGGFPALRTPSIAFDKIRVDKLGWTSATLAVDLGIDNDHESTLDFTNFDYALTMGGDSVGTGFLDDLGTVDGAQTGTLSVPLTINFLTTGTAIYDAITSGQVDLGLSASTDVDTPFGIVPLSVDQSGLVSVDL
ncbi:MAG: LEA type 2 family protein [Oligoflexia bacterium]|nr:LEA type 2 family protein [Oligoflexia bacterium]